MSGPFQSMANSFSSSISDTDRVGGEPIVVSTQEEFNAAFSIAYENITSASFNL
jgi:hypothetical protein